MNETLAVDRPFDTLRDDCARLLEAWRAATSAPADRALTKAFDDAAEALAKTPVEILNECYGQTPKDDPLHGVMALVAGLHYANEADRIRGTRTVDYVTADDWAAVKDMFERAEPLLRCAIDAGFAPGVALTILMRREQMSGSRTAAEHLFDEVLRLEPHWYGAWSQILAVREPRWGGSWPDMEALLLLSCKYLGIENIRRLEAEYWWYKTDYTSCFEGDDESALTFVDEGLRKIGGSGRERAMLLNSKAKVLNKLGRENEALICAREATSIRSGSSSYWFTLYCSALKLRLTDEAIMALERGAALDDEEAYTCAQTLGHTYKAGSDFSLPVVRDSSKAIAFFERAVELAGSDTERRNAANWLGREYERRKDDPRMFEDASRAYEIAIAAGDHYAPLNYANLLKQHLPDDPGTQRRITEYYGLAADRNSPRGAYEYAMRLLNGVGVAADRTQAIRWMRVGAARGDDDAAKTFRTLQIEDGQIDQAMIAQWMHVTQSGWQDIDCVRSLVDALASGKFGAHRAAAARVLADGYLQHRYDPDLALSLAIVNYNLVGGGDPSKATAFGLARDAIKTVRNDSKDRIAQLKALVAKGEAQEDDWRFGDRERLRVECIGLLKKLPGKLRAKWLRAAPQRIVREGWEGVR